MLKNYSWNIADWLERVLGRIWNQEQPYAFVKSLLQPLQSIADDFAARSIGWRYEVLYNSQQMNLDSVLNNLFDSTLRRIRVITLGDLSPEFIVYHDGEFDPIVPLLYHDGEVDEAPVVFHESEEDGNDDYVVIVPIALIGNDVEISAWVRRYNLATKKFSIEYE